MRELGVVLSVAQSVGSFYCVDVLRRGAMRRARSLMCYLLHADVQARTWQAGRPAAQSYFYTMSVLHSVELPSAIVCRRRHVCVQLVRET